MTDTRAEVHEAAQATLSIEQFGSTRSINAASAAAIAMHAWVRRHVFNQHVGRNPEHSLGVND